jgi:hypothetical protein
MPAHTILHAASLLDARASAPRPSMALLQTVNTPTMVEHVERIGLRRSDVSGAARRTVRHDEPEPARTSRPQEHDIEVARVTLRQIDDRASASTVGPLHRVRRRASMVTTIRCVFHAFTARLDDTVLCNGLRSLQEK